MRTIIAGGRDICDIQQVCEAVEQSGFEISEVVSGLAPGVDTVAIDFAKINEIPWKEFPAKWRIDGVYHPEAGFVRNAQMAEYADALVLVWDGRSKGSANMLETMKKKKKPFYVYLVNR